MYIASRRKTNECDVGKRFGQRGGGIDAGRLNAHMAQGTSGAVGIGIVVVEKSSDQPNYDESNQSYPQKGKPHPDTPSTIPAPHTID